MEWFNYKKVKPKLGEKVLVKMQWSSGGFDFNVAIYAINGYDHRKKGFFQNFDIHLNKENNIMKYDAWEYKNVISWCRITE